jgi:hypothetical protein
MLQALATFPKVEAISTLVAWSANTAYLNAVALFSLPILLVFSSHGRHPRQRFVVFACLFSLPLVMIHLLGIGVPNSSALPSCEARCAVIGQIIDVEIDRNQRMTRILLRAERFGPRLDQTVDLDFWLSESSDRLIIGDRLTGWASREPSRSGQSFSSAVALAASRSRSRASRPALRRCDLWQLPAHDRLHRRGLGLENKMTGSEPRR